MAKELYIDGYLVDLNEKDNPIALTFAVNDLADIKNRVATGTNNFKCPGTENNRLIFGLSDMDAFTQNQPYRTLPARIIQEGIEIVPSGIAIIQSAGREFEVQVLSGLVDFVSIIDKKKLSDLVFPEHTFNLTTVANSQTNTAIGHGYIYPIIDYGLLPVNGNSIDVRNLRPAVFTLGLVTRILGSAGYTYEGGIFSDARLQNEILPFSKDSFDHTEEYVTRMEKYRVQAIVKALPGYEGTSVHYDNNQVKPIPFETEIIDKQNLWNGMEYTAPEKLVLSMEMSVNINMIFAEDLSTFMVQIFRSGAWVNVYESRLDYITEKDINSFHDSRLKHTGDYPINAGEKIRAGIRYDNSSHGTNNIGFFVVDSFITFEVKDKTVLYGQNVQLSSTLPDVTQLEFLKDWMQRYGLTPIVDNYRKHISFHWMSELYNNKPNAVNWTDKFVDPEDDNAEFTIGNYGQVNFGRYKVDDAVPSSLGVGQFAVNNLTLKSEETPITSIYAATISVLRLTGREVAQINKVDPDETDDAKKVYKIKTQPRVLISKNVSGSGLIFTDGTNTAGRATVSIPYFIKEGFPGLSFEELFSAYYTEVIEYMLKRVRKVTRYVRLNEIDISQLDFFVPVYDENEAQYYYINQIIDYIEGEPAKVELIRM
ncbi:hypothetical protein B0I27_107107 [Arcticibacter pallidicorallinus]|uniref:Uncharacterized protein n=1 Tax=Arcticibacter pallidicorallinus TaxID=1259464 RepID=A0A2T0U0T1_9SPHI|nr:hypothetical protein [Arcticibacter pallidicorallinus]PRY51521.1 hypothetical protein B0I27_107107 [Arcticibacter pallidicorallinus]